MSLEVAIELPEGITAELHDNILKIKGEKGEIERKFFHPSLSLKIEGNVIKIVPTRKENKRIKSLMFTWKSHINNMIKGVKEGFEYHLKVYYVHFPMTVKVEGDKVVISNFLGEKGVRTARIMGDTQVEVKGDTIIVKGINKEDVGQTAANIELATKDKGGRDRRKFLDGIYIIKKGK
ncbi:MAG: 50S ribosomal protein L6 [Candidatus Nanohaloarchaeota archaeon]|nr:50S ribosomal protein L6 [Candidatus Nanohaloarchaeota archaeon]